MEETTLDRAVMGALGQSLGFHLRSRSSDYGCPAGGRQEWFRARHQECAHAVSEIETRRPPGGIGHARRMIPPLGGARRLVFNALASCLAPRVRDPKKPRSQTPRPAGLLFMERHLSAPDLRTPP